MQHGETTPREGTEPGLTTPACASGNLMSLIVRHEKAVGTEDDHETSSSRPPGGSFGEAGCLGNFAVGAVRASLCFAGAAAKERRIKPCRMLRHRRAPDSLGKLTSGVTPGARERRKRPRTGAQGTTYAPRYRPRPRVRPTPAQAQQPPPQVPEAGTVAKRPGHLSYHGQFRHPVPVTVLDKKHQQVAGLTYRDFRIYENNRAAEYSPLQR